MAALPDGVRVELEAIQEGGGLQHLQEVQAQVKVGRHERGAGRDMFLASLIAPLLVLCYCAAVAPAAGWLF